MNRLCSALLFLLICFSCSQDKDTQAKELSEPFFHQLFEEAGVEGSMYIQSLGNDAPLIYNVKHAQKGFLPASTYKIINSLIGLETGAATGKDHFFKYDGSDRRLKSWRQDHTLESAFRVSCFPCYRELARGIGLERMMEYVEKANYGNMVITPENVDAFWLIGDSKITVQQQVDFLRRMYTYQLPFSKANIDTVKDFMKEEQNEEYNLFAKTGWAQTEAQNIGWYVGFVEKGEQVYCFALNITGSRQDENFGDKRKVIAKAILKKLEII